MEEQYISKIEAYFKRTLSDDERKKFEKELQKDPVLKETFDQYKLAMDVMDQQIENDLRVKFSDWKKEKKHISRNITIYSAMAASIVILVGFYLIFKWRTGSATYEQLASRYYSLPEPPAYSMGDEEIHTEKGMNAYRKNSFQDAINEWLKVKDPDPEVMYYLGHAYYNEKEYQKAAQIFKKLAKGTSVYNYPSDWYLLLSLLSSGNTEQFQHQTEYILSDKKHPYYKDALELKNKFGKIHQQSSDI
jgi:tetratricopeptide (TPR) repeat protein